jgi:hypothetical protein
MSASELEALLADDGDDGAGGEEATPGVPASGAAPKKKTQEPYPMSVYEELIRKMKGNDAYDFPDAERDDLMREYMKEAEKFDVVKAIQAERKAGTAGSDADAKARIDALLYELVCTISLLAYFFFPSSICFHS